MTTTEPPYVLTDDPADPCVLCVQWEPLPHAQDGEVPTDPNLLDAQDYVPTWPGGNVVPRVCRKPCPTCAAAATIMEEERRRSALGLPPDPAMAEWLDRVSARSETLVAAAINRKLHALKASVAAAEGTLCPEAAERAAMDDGAFWDHVLGQRPPEDEYDPDEDPNDGDPVSSVANPCPVCGSPMACAYDAEGRPMIHAYAVEEVMHHD
jgi:ferredoxin